MVTMIVIGNKNLELKFGLWPTLHLVFGAKCSDPKIDERQTNISNTIAKLHHKWCFGAMLEVSMNRILTIHVFDTDWLNIDWG